MALLTMELCSLRGSVKRIVLWAVSAEFVVSRSMKLGPDLCGPFNNMSDLVHSRTFLAGKAIH